MTTHTVHPQILASRQLAYFVTFFPNSKQGNIEHCESCLSNDLQFLLQSPLVQHWVARWAYDGSFHKQAKEVWRSQCLQRYNVPVWFSRSASCHHTQFNIGPVYTLSSLLSEQRRYVETLTNIPLTCCAIVYHVTVTSTLCYCCHETCVLHLIIDILSSSVLQFF